MNNSFKKKIIRTTITLDTKYGTFSKNDANKLVIQGLRTSCNINYGNGAPMPTANLRIWDVCQNDMNRLTSIGWNIQGVQNNIVKIEVGDDPDSLDIVYQGNISFCYPDYSGAPDVCLCIESHMVRYWQLKPVPPVSFKGDVDVASAIEAITRVMDIGFENNGVSKKTSNSYLAGTAFDQIKSLAAHANIDYYIDSGKLIICEKGQPRANKTAVLSPSTGLIGYPVPTNTGANFSCLYNPNVRAGYKVTIKDSMVAYVNKTWRVTGLDINLESEMPDGQWIMYATVSDIGLAGSPPKVG